MFTYRSFTALTLLVAAAACSGTDVTRPGVDPSNMFTEASVSLVGSTLGSASSITISPATATLAIGSSLTLNGSIKSATGVDLTSTLGSQATLKSSDTTVATVSKTGVVTGRRNGMATITAALGTLSSKCVVTVGSPNAPSLITITPATANLAVGGTLALGASVKSAMGTDITASVASQMTLTLSDPTVATVSQAGVVTGVRNGVTTITVMIGTLSSKSVITVGSGASSPPPASAPPPTQSGGGAVSTMALVSDDYSHYSSTQALMANISTNIGGTGSPATALYTDGTNASLASIDNSVLYNGHATVKYNQAGGTSATPELWVNFPGGQKLTTMWFRAKIRFSQGFTTTGTLANSANAYKLLGWGWSGADGRGSIEITNTNQYQLYWYVFGKTGGQTVAGGVYTDVGRAVNEWTDGQWYDYVIEYQQTSSTAAVATTWIQKDGSTFTLRGTSAGTGPAGSIPGIGSVMLGMNFNQVRAAGQNQAIWIGQWEVIDGAKHANPYNIPGL